MSVATATAERTAATPVERKIRILTTQHKHGVPVWRDAVEMMPGWDEAGKFTGFKTLLWAWKLFRVSRHYDAIVTGSKRPELLFALAQLLFRRKRVPHVFIYICWNIPSKHWKAIWKTFLYRLVCKSASGIVIYSRKQVGIHRDKLGLAQHKLISIPYHLTLWDAKYFVRPGDYIFSGGDYTRDYRTLIEAVRGTPYRLVIAALYRDYFEGITLPENVSITTVSPVEFTDLVAGAALVVVPLRGGLVHSGGQQTYLNAMAMGKPVIVSDDCGADEYIRNGIDGVVLEPGDVDGMRAAIDKIMSDGSYAEQLGLNARQRANGREFSPEYFLTEVLRAVRSITPATVSSK